MVAIRYLGVRNPIEAMEGLLPTVTFLKGLADLYGPGDQRHRAPYERALAAQSRWRRTAGKGVT
jgi:hypothetical protein